MYLKCCFFEAWLEIVTESGQFFELDRCKDGIILYIGRLKVVVNKWR